MLVYCQCFSLSVYIRSWCNISLLPVFTMFPLTDQEALRYFTVDPVNGTIFNSLLLDYEDPSRSIGDRFYLMIRVSLLLSHDVA